MILTKSSRNYSFASTALESKDEVFQFQQWLFTSIAVLFVLLSYAPTSSAALVAYVSDFSGGRVLRTDGVSTTTIISGLSQPMGLTIGPDGNLYVAQQSGTRIGRYSTAGQAIGATFGTARPYTGIALGPDNALYTNGAENNYTMGVSERFIPQTGAGAGNGRESGNSASFIAQFPISYFEGMAFGPDGNLYVAAHSAGAVVVYQGPGGASPGALLTTLTGTAQPDGIAFGPDGKLYVAEQNANRISRWNGSSFSAFASDHLSTPVGVSFGPDGDLYVANYNGGNIAHFQGPAGAIPGKFVSLLSSSVGNPSYLAVVPEPTSAGFIAAAGIIGLLVRRR